MRRTSVVAIAKQIKHEIGRLFEIEKRENSTSICVRVSVPHAEIHGVFKLVSLRVRGRGSEHSTVVVHVLGEVSSPHILV